MLVRPGSRPLSASSGPPVLIFVMMGLTHFCTTIVSLPVSLTPSIIVSAFLLFAMAAVIGNTFIDLIRGG